jgi:hypothetical protein
VDRSDELVAKVDDDLSPKEGAGLGGLEDLLPAAADLEGGGVGAREKRKEKTGKREKKSRCELTRERLRAL